MDSNKDMQDCIMNQHSYAANDPRTLQALKESQNDAYYHGYQDGFNSGYQNGYLDGFNAGIEHVVNKMKKLADTEGDKDGQS